MNRLSRVVIVLCSITGFAGLLHAEEGACRADVQKYCSDIQPGEGRVPACLKAHGPSLSADCQTQVKQAREEFREKRKAAREACAADRQKFCADVKPGEGRIKDCMSQHASELSDACRAAMHSERK